MYKEEEEKILNNIKTIVFCILCSFLFFYVGRWTFPVEDRVIMEVVKVTDFEKNCKEKGGQVKYKIEEQSTFGERLGGFVLTDINCVASEHIIHF